MGIKHLFSLVLLIAEYIGANDGNSTSYKIISIVFFSSLSLGRLLKGLLDELLHIERPEHSNYGNEKWAS